MQVTYSGIEITYRENDNRWEFELRGKQRSAESLAKAKEAIDKPEPVKKVEFKRMEAYIRSRYGKSDYNRGEVTSIAEGRGYGNRREVWVMVGKYRSKIDENDVYEINPANDATIAEIQGLQKEITAAHFRMIKLPIPNVE